MRVNPANHLSHNVCEIRPDNRNDGQDRGDEFLRRPRRATGRAAGYATGLMDGAKPASQGAAVAALTTRAEIEAGALVGALGLHGGGRSRDDTKISAIIVRFGDRAYAEFATGSYPEFVIWRGAVALGINGYDSFHCVPHFSSDRVKLEANSCARLGFRIRAYVCLKPISRHLPRIRLG